MDYYKSYENQRNESRLHTQSLQFVKDNYPNFAIPSALSSILTDYVLHLEKEGRIIFTSKEDRNGI